MATTTIEWTDNAHRDYKLEDVEPLLTFLRKNASKLVDEADASSFKDIVTYLENAKTIADTDKKVACLVDAATKYANQLAFRLFVEGSLDNETAEVFKKFETVKTTSENTRGWGEEDKSRADAITKLQNEYMEERQDFEIFTAVINGMTVEQAKAKQAEYQARRAQALENAVQNGQI